MLPPYIIEQIRKREEDEARRVPVIHLPLPEPARRPREAPHDIALDEEADRGVVVIDLV